MARVQLNVTLIGDYQFTYNLTSWHAEIGHIYKMVDDEGKVYVWKTMNELYTHVECERNDGRCYTRNVDKDGNEIYERLEFLHKGDKFTITASVKEESEYKGEKQTILQRVKVIDIIEKQPTYEEKQEQKRADQIATIQEGDFIYTMPYRQYKEHYSDCEAIANSFDEEERTIDVIIRAGRLKASGTRFQHYKKVTLLNETGERLFYRAISEHTALRRANKEFGGHEWTIESISNWNH